MPRYDAVGFDLLTALLDTLPLWRSAAGDDDIGTRWHTANQRLLRGQPYRAFDELVHESAKEVGLGHAHATTLLSRWGEAQPWPDTRRALIALGSTRPFCSRSSIRSMRSRPPGQSPVRIDFSAMPTPQSNRGMPTRSPLP